jgi:DNA-binding XRE family transcriptional regulator
MGQFEELYKRTKILTDQLYEAADTDREKRKIAIAQALKTYRLGNRLTQEDLAKQLGVSKMEIIRWEGEKTMPSSLALERLQERGIIPKG